MTAYHVPVMAAEVLSFLRPHDGALILDGTLGGGGHARLVLEACPDCRVIAVDRDPDALAEAEHALAHVRDRVRFLHGRFDVACDDAEVRDRGLDGALLDLGVSSHQLDDDARGFAFRRGVALDMRMDPGEERDAVRFLSESNERELERVFRGLASAPGPRRVPRYVFTRRPTRIFPTRHDLVAALAGSLGRAPTPQDKARIFQAVRIAVNEELESLERGLPALRDALKAGGVLVVIAYHSLEDRMVKNAFRDWSAVCVCPPGTPVCTCRGRALGETLTKKPVRPSDEETVRNPRARSARLRAWRRAA